MQNYKATCGQGWLAQLIKRSLCKNFDSLGSGLRQPTPGFFHAWINFAKICDFKSLKNVAFYATDWSRILFSSSTSKWKVYVTWTNWSHDRACHLLYYAIPHKNSGNLRTTFSNRLRHRKSVDCNVKNKSAGQEEWGPQHRGVRVWEEKRMEEKIAIFGVIQQNLFYLSATSIYSNSLTKTKDNWS